MGQADDERMKRIEELAAELITSVEGHVESEAPELRRRIDEALEYMSHVTAPNMHTLSHIRRYLIGEK